MTQSVQLDCNTVFWLLVSCSGLGLAVLYPSAGQKGLLAFRRVLAHSSGSCQKPCQPLRCSSVRDMLHMCSCAAPQRDASTAFMLNSQPLCSFSSLNVDVGECTLQSESQFRCPTSMHYKVNAGHVGFRKMLKSLCTENCTVATNAYLYGRVGSVVTCQSLLFIYFL